MKAFLCFLVLAVPVSAQTKGDTLRSTIIFDRFTATRVYFKVPGDTAGQPLHWIARTTFNGLKYAKVAAPVVTPPDTQPTPVPPVAGGMFFNSAEPGCGTDPNVLLCDDFEDGHWYEKNCDQANSSGGLLQTDGWCGTIYNPAGLSGGTARCGGVGFRSACAATTGVLTSTTGNMADHALREGVSEVWVRFYTKPLAGYRFGQEKMLTFNDGNPGDGGIKWGVLKWNCGAGSNSTAGNISFEFIGPMDECARQNVGSAITLQSGNWYFYEVHYRLPAPGQANGVFELWVDDCGPAGTSCPVAPTLRMRRTDVRMDRTSTNQLIRVIWFEAWANPTSQGERLIDQVKASKAGPIGFMR